MADLAIRYRPDSLDAFFGQTHLLGTEAPLRILIEKGALQHAFFYGPPGSGKTTLARIIAQKSDTPFYALNATTLKVEEIRKICNQYRNALQKPLLFIDEVHRLAKNQQEILLPCMENYDLLLIGASTENPYFSLTAAMRSRSLLFEFKPLEHSELDALLNYVIGKEAIVLEQEARQYLLDSSGGDARALLNLLGAGRACENPITRVTLNRLRPHAIQEGSSEANTHYNMISAMIKSIRGSDPDAALYYLARLIEGGEPPEYIARRMVILASEDIGNANPQALNLAVSTMQAALRIGYPESRIILAQCAIYLAACPKSNSAYAAINAAQEAVRSGNLYPVPDHLKSPPSKDYRYPHDFGGWVAQDYLAHPMKLVNLKPIGYEQKLMEWLEKIRR